MALSKSSVPRDLLPLPLAFATATPQKCLSRCVKRRLERRARWQTWVNDAVVSLNDLSGCGQANDNANLSRAQGACLDRMTSTIKGMGAPPSDLTASGALSALCGTTAGYGFDSIPRASFQRELLSLPPLGLDHADGSSIMEGGDNAFWKDWRNHMLRPVDDAARLKAELGLRTPYSDPVIRDGKRYGQFLADLLERDLIDFVPLTPAQLDFSQWRSVTVA